MSITAASLIVDVNANTEPAERRLRGFGSTAKTMLTGAMMGVGIVITQSLLNAASSAMRSVGEAVQGASDFNETLSKTNAILGDAAAGVIDFSKTAAIQMGMTQNAALQAAGNFAVFGKSAGLVGDELGSFAESLTVLASDFASFYNTSPERAIQSISAALRGESEPIRTYGVLLNEATLRQRAFSMGLIETTKEALTPQNRVLAASAEIFAQTADAQGDFARTSIFLANQQRIMAAQMGEVSNVVGTSFLPVWTEFARIGNNLLEQILPYLGQVLAMYVTPFMLQLADAMRIAGENLARFIELLVRGTDPVGAFVDAFNLEPLVEQFNMGIDATEYWLNASIRAFNDWLLGVDMIVTNWFQGVNLIIDGANTIIQAFAQISVKARNLAAIMALTRGDIGGAMAQMDMASVEQNIRIPNLERPNAYAVSNAMDFQQLGRIPTTAGALREFNEVVSDSTTSWRRIDEASFTLGTSLGELGESTKDVVGELESALSRIPGLFSTSQVTESDMDRAAAGLPVNYADNYVRRAKDELLNGVDWADIDPAEVATSLGLDPSVPARIIVDELVRQWESGEYFANPENLAKIDWQAVKDAALKEANAVLGQQNIIAEAMSQGITIESFKPLATGSVANISNALSEAVSTPENTKSLMDAGERAYSVWFRGWKLGAEGSPIVPPGNYGTTGGTIGPATQPMQSVTLPGGFQITVPTVPKSEVWAGESDGVNTVGASSMSRNGGRDGSVNITVNASVANDFDLEHLAVRLASVIDSRRRTGR